MSRVLLACSVVLLSLCPARTASAQCPVFYGFEQVLKESSIAVVGKVLAVTPGRIDLALDWIMKGSGLRQRITVWDPQVSDAVRNSENAELHRLKVGAEIALAGVTVAQFLRDRPGLSLIAEAQSNDVAVVPCRQSYRVLDSDAARREFVGRTIP